MNLLGFPSTTGSLPEAVLTAATMEPVPSELNINFGLEVASNRTDLG